METNYCQSCAMPLTNPQETATEKDGTPNPEYCIYCYKDGAFTEDVTMEETIEKCAQFLDDYNEHAEVKLTLEEAKAQMRQIFPTLKRWKNA